MKNRFETETGVQTKNIIMYTVSGVALILLSLLGLLNNLLTFLFFAGCSVIAVTFLIIFQTGIKWRIVFVGDELYLYRTKDNYEIRFGKKTRSELTLKETNAKKDRGILTVNGTVFKYGNIKNFSKLKEYTEENLE
jgi:hypothetical protein